MAHVFAIPELAWNTAAHLPSSDIAHLTQCSRNLHQTLLPALYRHIEFSLYKITPMHCTLQQNPSLAKHTRSLSITVSGQPSDDEKIAYRSNPLYGPAVFDNRKIRSDIRKKLMVVIREAAKHGNLRYFSWDRESYTTGHSWILDFKKMWSHLSRSAKSLRELDCNFYLVSQEARPSVSVVSMVVCCVVDMRY